MKYINTVKLGKTNLKTKKKKTEFLNFNTELVIRQKIFCKLDFLN